VVLSVGLLPSPDNRGLARLFDLSLDERGGLPKVDEGGVPRGIFTAGTALGPMTIAQSVGSAEKAVFDVVRYLGTTAVTRRAV